jgi:2-C-methyl-D-erythritol 4-phosphate cytidylyltransferase
MFSAEKGPGEGRRVGVAVPAAGLGSRMGGIRKPFLEVRGAPLLSWALKPFLAHQEVTAVAVALSEEDLRSPPDWLACLDPRIRLVLGGETRGDSVRAALGALPENVTFVAVHDAARPLVTGDILDRCLAAVGRTRGAVAGWPAVDTLKEIDPEGRVVGTPRRDRIWHAQTPQVFPVTLLLDAYRRAKEAGSTATDDSALVEEIGGEVVMVRGSPWNLKVTRPEDLKLAELFLEAGGMGWDPDS